MNISHNSVPSAEAKQVLASLTKAVTNALEKKQKLGQYAVIWKDNKPHKKVNAAPDAPASTIDNK